jgi:DNA-directed RNA polymerase subunit F
MKKMINANEAHKIMEKNSTRKNELRNIVEKVMPVCENHIRRVAEAGCARAVIARDEIMKSLPFVVFTKKEILDAVVEELRGYGFKAETTASYNSIHVEW